MVSYHFRNKRMRLKTRVYGMLGIIGCIYTYSVHVHAWSVDTNFSPAPHYHAVDLHIREYECTIQLNTTELTPSLLIAYDIGTTQISSLRHFLNHTAMQGLHLHVHEHNVI